MDARILLDFDSRYSCLNNSFLACGNGDVVRSWGNLGSQGGAFLQNTGGIQPFFRTGIINGFPAVDFTVSGGKIMSYAGLGAFAGDLTIFVVHVPYAAATLSFARLLSYNESSGFWIMQQATSGIPGSWGGAILNLSTPPYVNQCGAVNGFGMITSLSRSGGIVSAGNNGQRSLGSMSTAGTIPSSTLNIGSKFTPPQLDDYCGQVARVLIFGGTLTEKERYSVEMQLSVLYQIPLVPTYTLAPPLPITTGLVADANPNAGCLDGSGVACVDATGCKTITDQSVSANNWVQNTALARPLWRASRFGSGLPGLYFDGVNAFTFQAANFTGLDDLTAFCVYRPDNVVPVSNSRIVSVGGPTFDYANGFLFSRTDTTHIAAFFHGPGSAVNLPIAANGAPNLVQSVRRVGSNAVVHGLNATRTQDPTSTPGTLATRPIYIGDWDGLNAKYTGHIGRMLIYNRAFTDAEWTTMENYLMLLYGVASMQVLALDRPITIESGKSYIASIYDTSVAFGPVDCPISSPMVGSWDAFPILSIAPPVPQAPVIIKANDLVPELFRVIGISEEEKQKFGILAVNYNPSKFAAVDNNTTLDPQQTSALPLPYMVGVPAGGSAVVTYVPISGSDAYQERLEVNWSAPNDPMVVSYATRYRKDDGNWIIFNGDTSATNAFFDIVGFGTYEIEIRAVNKNRQPSAPFATSLVYGQTLVTTPSVSPASQTFTSGTAIVCTLLVDAGNIARYTIDGSDVNSNSTQWPTVGTSYTTLTLPSTTNTTLKVKAYVGAFESQQLTQQYSVSAPPALPTCASVSMWKSGTAYHTGNITCNCATSGATITCDKGAGPFTYTVPFSIGPGGYVTAAATKAGFNPSPNSYFDNSDPNL